ncbi:MAG: RNA polymerase sigma factor [Bacteroidota bacterium]
MEVDDDRQLVHAIAAEDQSAFEVLYTSYSSKVYNTLLSYTRSEEDAEELLQDVFVTVYESAGKFRFDSSVSTWLYRITVNKALDFLRKTKTAKRSGVFISLFKKDSGEVAVDAADFDHPGVKLENVENARLLFRVIDELPDNQKTAFILTQIEGLPQAEAGEVMKISRKAVESLLQRAKSNLRKALEKYYPDRGIKH